MKTSLTAFLLMSLFILITFSEERHINLNRNELDEDALAELYEDLTENDVNDELLDYGELTPQAACQPVCSNICLNGTCKYICVKDLDKCSPI